MKPLICLCSLDVTVQTTIKVFVLKDEFSNINCILAAQGEHTKPVIQFSFQELSGKISAKLRKKSLF